MKWGARYETLTVHPKAVVEADTVEDAINKVRQERLPGALLVSFRLLRPEEEHFSEEEEQP